MKNIFCLSLLVLLSTFCCAMEEKKILIKILNGTPNAYYAKIPEKLLSEKNWLPSQDEFQRWGIEPNSTEKIELRAPIDSQFTGRIEIKSSCEKDVLKNNVARVKDPQRGALMGYVLGSIVVYKGPLIPVHAVYVCSKFEPLYAVHSKKEIDLVTLLITQKESGSTLLNLCAE